MNHIKHISLIIIVLTFFCQANFSQGTKRNLVKWAALRDANQFEIILNGSNDKKELIVYLDIPLDYEFRKKIVKGVWPIKDQTQEKDEFGYVHKRYAQYYKGIRIDHSDIRAHYFEDKLVLVNGTYVDEPNIDVSVILTKEEAIKKAMVHIGAKKYVWEDEQECEALITRKSQMGDVLTSCYPDPESVICLSFIPDTVFRLAYKVDIRALEPFSHHYVYVDAKNGEILNEISRIQRLNGTAVTRYSGTQTILTQLTNSYYDYNYGWIYTYSLISPVINKKCIETKYMTNNSTIDPRTGSYFTNNSNYWTNTNCPSALDAHWGSMVSSDYFLEKYNFPQLPPNALQFFVINYFGYFPLSFNHDCEWDEGLGYTLFEMGSANVSLDAIAHEYGHGVNQGTAQVGGLATHHNDTEPNCIKEGLSDIWAVCVQNYANNRISGLNKNIWLIGNEINSSFGYLYGVRPLSVPVSMSYPNTYQGNYWNSLIPSQITHGRGCVMGHWFYILSEGKTGTNDLGNSYSVAGITIEKAEKIVWYAQTKYMTQNTDFANARHCTIAAASVLFGSNSNEVKSVTNAWYAVGVGNCFSNVANFTNQTVSTNTTLYECNINIQNITVANNATLKILAGGDITVNNVTVVSGAKLILQAGGNVIVNEIDIKLGAEFEIK